MLLIDSTTCHSTYLDPRTGEGLLLAPRPCDDVQLDPFSASLHASSELATLGRLQSMGWELSDDEHGAPAWVHVGWTEDGREAFGLYGRESITSAPTLEEQAEAMARLLHAAGVLATVPAQRLAAA